MSQPHCPAFCCWSTASTWAPNQLEHLPSTSPRAGVALGRSRVQRRLAVDLDGKRFKSSWSFLSLHGAKFSTWDPLGAVDLGASGLGIGVTWRNRLCFGASFGLFGLCSACSQLKVVFLATLWVGQGLKCLIDQMKGFLEGFRQSKITKKRYLWSCSVQMFMTSGPSMLLHIYLTEIQP